MALNAYSLTLGVIAINNTFLTALFNFLSRFFAALAEEQVEQEDTMASVTEVTEWTGAPPYRYIDVSRYQGNITLEGWKKVKPLAIRASCSRPSAQTAGYPSEQTACTSTHL